LTDQALVAAAIICLAWLIGMAKPMSWALLEAAVTIPTTAPLASRSGPPLLPGLIGASVWTKPVRSSVKFEVLSPTVMLSVQSGDDARGHRVRERAERAADGNRQLADLDGARVAERHRHETGGVDFDQRQIVNRINLDNRARQLAPVIERHSQRGRAGDHVVVGQDEPVRSDDEARAGAR